MLFLYLLQLVAAQDSGNLDDLLSAYSDLMTATGSWFYDSDGVTDTIDFTGTNLPPITTNQPAATAVASTAHDGVPYYYSDTYGNTVSTLFLKSRGYYTDSEGATVAYGPYYLTNSRGIVVATSYVQDGPLYLTDAQGATLSSKWIGATGVNSVQATGEPTDQHSSEDSSGDSTLAAGGDNSISSDSGSDSDLTATGYIYTADFKAGTYTATEEVTKVLGELDDLLSTLSSTLSQFAGTDLWDAEEYFSESVDGRMASVILRIPGYNGKGDVLPPPMYSLELFSNAIINALTALADAAADERSSKTSLEDICTRLYNDGIDIFKIWYTGDSTPNARLVSAMTSVQQALITAQASLGTTTSISLFELSSVGSSESSKVVEDVVSETLISTSGQNSDTFSSTASGDSESSGSGSSNGALLLMPVFVFPFLGVLL